MSRIMKRFSALILFILLSVTIVHAQENVDAAYLWDAATGNLIARFDSDLPIWDARLNADGSRLLVALNGGVLRMIATETGDIFYERRLEAERGSFNAPSLIDVRDPEIMIIRMNEQFHVWSWAADTLLYSGDALNREIVPDVSASRVITMRNEPPALVIYDGSAPDAPLEISLPDRPMTARWNDNGSLIAVIYNGGMRIVDSNSGEKLFELADARLGDAYSETVWSPDGRYLAVQMTHSLDYEHSAVGVIDTLSMRQIGEFPFRVGVFSTEWSADSRRILTAAYESAGIRVYDVESGELVQQYGNLSDEYLSAQWNADNTRIVAEAVDSGGDVINVWDTTNGNNLFERVYPLGVNDLIWNDARSMVLIRRYPEMTITVIDPANPTEAPITLDHEADLLGAAWSLDGARIITWTGESRG